MWAGAEKNSSSETCDVTSSGETVMRNGFTVSGVALMWSGNALMLGLLTYIYLKLSRN